MDVPSETDSGDPGEEEPAAKIPKKHIRCKGCDKEFKNLILHITKTKEVKCSTAYSATEIDMIREVNKKISIKKKTTTFNTKNRAKINSRQKNYNLHNRATNNSTQNN